MLLLHELYHQFSSQRNLSTRSISIVAETHTQVMFSYVLDSYVNTQRVYRCLLSLQARL